MPAEHLDGQRCQAESQQAELKERPGQIRRGTTRKRSSVPGPTENHGRQVQRPAVHQAQSVLRSSVFSQRSDSRPGRRSLVIQVIALFQAAGLLQQCRKARLIQIGEAPSSVLTLAFAVFEGGVEDTARPSGRYGAVA
jgi:hypothetical protein